MMIRHFHNIAECSARIVSWDDIDSAAKREGSPVIYLGNHADDDFNDLYALFAIEQYRFCIKLIF